MIGYDRCELCCKRIRSCSNCQRRDTKCVQCSNVLFQIQDDVVVCNECKCSVPLCESKPSAMCVGVCDTNVGVCWGHYNGTLCARCQKLYTLLKQRVLTGNVQNFRIHKETCLETSPPQYPVTFLNNDDTMTQQIMALHSIKKMCSEYGVDDFLNL